MSDVVIDTVVAPAPTPSPTVAVRQRPAPPEPVQPVAKITVTKPVTSDKPEEGSLLAVMGKIAKLHGNNVIRPARQALSTFQHLPTGIFTLDMALFGGFPESMINVLIGWESSGKTTISMRVAAAAQRKYPDRRVVFIDAEGTFAPDWAEKHRAGYHLPA